MGLLLLLLGRGGRFFFPSHFFFAHVKNEQLYCIISGCGVRFRM